MEVEDYLGILVLAVCFAAGMFVGSGLTLLFL